MNRVISFLNLGLFIVLISQVTHQRVVEQVDLNKTIIMPEIPTRQLQAAVVTKPFPEIQVNRLPHPFNVNGQMPYQVWVDGERVPMNTQESRDVIKALNLKFVQPDDTAAIHSGAGWMRPLKLNKPDIITRTR